jgi:Icc-related predicted phosphoesterase
MTATTRQMKKTVRALTVADLHQSSKLYRLLGSAVSQHQPDVVAIVGDCLDFGDGQHHDRFSIQECAAWLSSLPVKHMVFVRGNHEDENWVDFVQAWPLEQRPLIALYGTATTVGPLVILGFPCLTGSEEAWCQTLPKSGNQLTRDRTLSGRNCLPPNPDGWLAPLLRKHGPAARTLWLMHEPPVALPIAGPQTCNFVWTDTVESHRPLVVVSGHDHKLPLENNTWNAKLGDTLCVNAGQDASDLHYCVLDFEFRQETPCLPTRVIVQAFPWRQRVEIGPA